MLRKASHVSMQQSKIEIINQTTATLIELILKITVERKFFQNNSITPSMLIYLANDLTTSLSQSNENDFSLSMELKILSKQIFRRELSSEEKKYDQSIHQINVTKEFFNGIKYTMGFSIFKNLYNSISSAISNGLNEYIPSIVGYTAASYVSPYALTKLIEKTLSKLALTQAQKNIIRPWLNTVGRLAVGFIPKAQANEQGVIFQYPSSKGHVEYIKKYQSNSYQNNMQPTNLENSDNREHVKIIQSTMFKLHSIHTMTDNSIQLSLYDKNNEKIIITFYYNENQNNSILTVKCSDYHLEKNCNEYLKYLFLDHANLHIAKSIVKGLALANQNNNPLIQTQDASGALDSLLPKALGLTTSVIISSSLHQSYKFSQLGHLLSLFTHQNLPVFAKPVISGNVNKIKSSYTRIGDFNVVYLTGSHYEMGNQYGMLMQQQLDTTYKIIENFYVTQHKVPFEKMVEKVNLFYNRYSYKCVFRSERTLASV